MTCLGHPLYLSSMVYKAAPTASITGSSLIGETEPLDGADLERLFGTPRGGDGYKVTAEWIVADPAGNILTIYDWKVDGGVGPGMLYRWHVGGIDKEAGMRLVAWLNANLRRGR